MFDTEPRNVLAWYNDNDRCWFFAAEIGGTEYVGPNPQCAACGNVGYTLKGRWVVCTGHEPDSCELDAYGDDPEMLDDIRHGCRAHYSTEYRNSEEVCF